VMSIETPKNASGEIITFYSYKGGTGRTMALSNVACLLAERSLEAKGILMIDWDLEVPGLHRFFQDKLFLPDAGSIGGSLTELNEQPGLIDLFLKLDALIDKSDLRDEVLANDVLDRVKFEDFIFPTHIPNLSLLKAGRFDEKYSNKVNTFNWEGFYNQCPLLIRLFAERLADRYRYILIDSRTGHTDISGICTMLMPQKLVVVFTPNRQSYTGIEELIRRATTYRRRSDDLRPLLIYPLPSRIEFSRDDLRASWRFGNAEQGITGYQPMFEVILKKVYGLDKCNLSEYFEEVQIQQSPNYAYGEEIAVKVEKTKDSFSLSRSYEVFTDWLVKSVAPWQRVYSKPPTSPSMIRILFLSMNPMDTVQLKVLQEYNEIYDKLRVTSFRDQFELVQKTAITIRDLAGVLLENNPDIVHFSGHGSQASTLIFQNEDETTEIVPTDVYADLFKMSKNIRCVFLNACYSERLAKSMAKQVDCVVGTTTAISDEAATKFAVYFYQGLCFGMNLKEAFDLGRSQLLFLNIPEEQMPRLELRSDVNPSQLVFVHRRSIYIPSSVQAKDSNGELLNIKRAIEQCEQFITGDVSLEKWWGVTLPVLRKLSTNPESLKIIGSQNAYSLNLIMINLANAISNYRASNELGYVDDASLTRKEIAVTSRQLLDTLRNIYWSISN
jgi:MinD-like ATPase involved in chromosome partitioning or flagellar assembly